MSNSKATLSGSRMIFRNRYIISSTMLGMALTPAMLLAQDTTNTAANVPLREVGPIEARAEHALLGVSMLRALPDGSVFVNDVQRRQLVRFDASLKNHTIVADTAAGAPLPYGQRPSGLLPYLGDSSIVVDPSTLSFVVLDRSGKAQRVMAAPRPNDVNLLSNMNLGSHAFDAKGRLYYRLNAGGQGGGNFQGLGGAFRGGGGGGGEGRGGQGGQRQGQQGPGGQGGRGANPQNQPDSLPIIRADFDTRHTDTVAWVKVPRTDFTMTPAGPDGDMRMTAKINPLPQGDDWTLLADGTVAVVRVLDYHIDYYAPDGTHTSSPKLPFDWKRITDEDKVTMIDSLKLIAKDATDRMAAMSGGRGFRTQFEPVEPHRLPDYFPPIRPGTTMADYEGNLWVLPATSSLAAQLASQMGPGGNLPGMGGRGGFPGGGGGPPGGGRQGGGNQQAGQRQGAQQGTQAATPPAARRDSTPVPAAPTVPYIYDVVTRKGELAYKVKLPVGRQLIGFGPNGAVYMIAREGRQVFLERARLTPQ